MIIIRYLIKETIKSQFGIFFVLFLIFISQKFIQILADASDGNIPGGLILSLVGLNMPAMGLLMLPLSLFIGILLTFGRLYAESEITVMNATGMGNTILLRAAFYLALITGIAAAFNALWLSPWSQEQATTLMESVEAESGIELLQKGQFQRSPDNTAVVFIDDFEKNDNKKLLNIFMAQPVPKGSLRPSILTAERGIVKKLDDGRQILELQKGHRYEGIPSRLDYLKSEFESYAVLIGQQEVKNKRRDWDAIPTIELMKSHDLEAKAELQWRLSLIICIPLLTMIVVPLSAVNPRQGRFAKLAPAILLYLAYFLSLSAGKSAIEDGGLSPNIGLWAINLVLLSVGLVLNLMDSVFIRELKDKVRRKPKHV